jgi:hypothetical protein
MTETTKSTGQMLQIRVIYNGRPLDLQVNRNQPVRGVLQRAAAQFGVAGDAQRLLLRYEGRELPLDEQIGQVVPDGAEIFLEPRAQRGGAGS